MKKRIIAALAVSILVVSAPAFARGKKGAPTQPGTYADWKGEIDSLEIVNSFKLSDYSSFIVVPLDTDETPLPKKDDNTYQPVKQVLASPNDAFIDGIKEELPRSSGLTVEEGKMTSKGGTLILKARIEEMDPGSQAARYFAGFGAGAARTRISGEVIDAKTKEVLFKFTQERRSGVGMMGGDYVSLMNRNLAAIGNDIALILESF